MYTCERCGHTPEMTIRTRIMQAGMQMESDGSLEAALETEIEAISPELHAEFEREGTQHPLAGNTISEIRALADAGELSTEGSEVRMNRTRAAMEEWNRRVHAGELTKKQIQRFQYTSSVSAMQQLGWENPY